METTTQEVQQVPEVLELAGGVKVPTGKMVDVEPAPTPEPEPEPQPEPTPASEPQPNPLEGIDLELVRSLVQDPAKTAVLFSELTKDYDAVPPLELYKEGWIAQHSYPGAKPSVLEAAFNAHMEEKLYGFDPNADDLGLPPLEAVSFMRTVETTRSQKKENQAEVAKTIESLKGIDNQAPNTYQNTPEQNAEMAKFYREELAKIRLGYDGLPPELVSALDPSAPEQFKAKIIQDIDNKPFLGLERYIMEGDEGFDVAKIAQDQFILENYNQLVAKALEHGRSLGRAELAKEYEGKLNPAPQGSPGGATNNPGFVTLSNGTKVPLR